MKTLRKTIKHHKSDINTYKQLREGQSMEDVMRINTVNKTQPAQILPELYQERKDGIDPTCDIRTDKFLLAEQAMDKVTRAHLLAHANKDKFGNKDNTWITDEEGKPMFEPVTTTTE